MANSKKPLLFIVLFASQSYAHDDAAPYHWAFVVRYPPTLFQSSFSWTQHHLEEVLTSTEPNDFVSRPSDPPTPKRLLCESSFSYPPEPREMAADVLFANVKNKKKLVDGYLTNQLLAKSYEKNQDACKEWVKALAKMMLEDGVVTLDSPFKTIQQVWAELDLRCERRERWPEVPLKGPLAEKLPPRVAATKA